MKVKKIIAICFVIVIFSSLSNVFAFEPYKNYTYSSEKMAYVEPYACVPLKQFGGSSIKTKDFNNPNDIFVDKNKNIYIVDTNNNRIVILDSAYHFKTEIISFDNNGKQDFFNKPMGIFVDGKEQIYIADSDNLRVIKLNADYTLNKEYGRPKTSLIEDKQKFRPLKVAADVEERLFILSDGFTQGMVELDKDGKFLAFYGAIKTTPNLIDMFWKSFATKEQKERLTKTIPTVYSNLDIDKFGFIFGTVRDSGEEYNPEIVIRRLNFKGEDILRKVGNNLPMGDLIYRDGEYSKIEDINCGENETYSVLDSRKGRIFTYDQDGNLLYVFGCKSDQIGGFIAPVGLALLNDKYLVLDKDTNLITVFGLTEYGKAINEAVKHQYERKYDKAFERWEMISNQTSRLELAYKNIGITYLKKNDFINSMDYFELAKDREDYSKAYDKYRQDFLARKFYLIFFIIISAFIAIIILRIIYKKQRRKKNGIVK